jgi:hypothetical protein
MQNVKINIFSIFCVQSLTHSAACSFTKFYTCRLKTRKTYTKSKEMKREKELYFVSNLIQL